MVYNKDEFLQYLKDNDYKVFVCYDGFVNDKTVTERMPMEQYTPKDATAVTALQKIENIINRKPGKFTFLLANNFTNRAQMMRVQVDTYPQLNVIDKTTEQIENHEYSSNENNMFGSLSNEEINKRIEEQVNARLLAREKQLEIEEKDRKLKEFETNGGKLAFVISELIKNLGLNPAQMAKTSTVMNGTEFQPETQQAAPVEYTPAQQANLEKAFGILLKKLGYKTVLNLAKKVHEGQADAVLPMIENFANS